VNRHKERNHVKNVFFVVSAASRKTWNPIPQLDGWIDREN